MLAPGVFRGIESNSERIFWIGPTSLLLRGERHFHGLTVTKHLTISCKNWDKAFPKNEFLCAQKKLGEGLLSSHATIGTKHLPKRILGYSEEIMFFLNILFK